MIHTPMSCPKSSLWTHYLLSTKLLLWQANNRPFHDNLYCTQQPLWLHNLILKEKAKGPKAEVVEETASAHQYCVPIVRKQTGVKNCYFKHGFPPSYCTCDQAYTMQISNDSSTSIAKTIQTHTRSKSDQSFQVSREDYNQLMTLLHSSNKDPSTTSQFVTNQPNHAPSSHIVSCLS